MTQLQPFYDKKIDCPVCEYKYTTKRVRTRFTVTFLLTIEGKKIHIFMKSMFVRNVAELKERRHDSYGVSDKFNPFNLQNRCQSFL